MLSYRAVSRVVAAIIIIVIVVVAGAGAAIYISTSPTSTLTSVSTTSANVSTLSIDVWAWPNYDLNDLAAVAESPWPYPLVYTVYQPLVSVNETAEYGQGYVQYLPGLAANWTASPDAKTYTFNLRQNVHFSDGNPFNAYQVWAEMYGFYYLSANSTTWLESYPVFDMSQVQFGPSTIAMLTRSGVINPSPDMLRMMMNSSWPIYVTGPNQIVFHLKAPFLWFPGALVIYEGLMFDVQWLLEHGGWGTPSLFNSYFNTNPIPGSGPYVVTGVGERAYIKFAQDPNYWGNSLTAAEIAAQPIWSPGHVNNVIVYYKPDDVSRYADLSTGAVQMADIEASVWPLVASNPQYQYLTTPSWGAIASIMSLNTQLYPTNITDVRLAIVHAINYTELYQKAYLGHMVPFFGPEYPLWKQFYDLGNVQPYQYNLTLAKQYLAKANITSMPTLVMRTYADCEVCSTTAQIVQAQLGQLGISVNIEVLQAPAYFGAYGSYQTNVQNAAQGGQITFVNGGPSWGPATLTPTDYWVTFVSCKSIWGNFAGYCNPTVQRCVDSFTNTTDVSEIQRLCVPAEQQLYNDAPYTWVGIQTLWLPPGGSIVWKTGAIKSFMVEPCWTGTSTSPIFQTITFG